jgi:hypothetical protein
MFRLEVSESMDNISRISSFSAFVFLSPCVEVERPLYPTVPCSARLFGAEVGGGTVMFESRDLCSSVKEGSQVM